MKAEKEKEKHCNSAAGHCPWIVQVQPSTLPVCHQALNYLSPEEMYQRKGGHATTAIRVVPAGAVCPALIVLCFACELFSVHLSQILLTFTDTMAER